MSKQLLLAVSFVVACGRIEGTTGASVSAHAAPAVSSQGTPSGSRNSIEAAPSSVQSASAPAAISSAAAAVLRGTVRSTLAVGYTSGLRLEPDAATYCDSRGGRALDLVSGIDHPRERPCEKDEQRNSDCGGIAFVDAVREPGPDDIIDAKKGSSFPVNGHIHDCAFDSGLLLVGTGLEVVAFDVESGRRKVKSKEAGDQVAVTSTWMAWSAHGKVFAERR